MQQELLEMLEEIIQYVEVWRSKDQEVIDKAEALIKKAKINAPAVPQGEPVACLVRQRTLRTRAAIAHDGQDHFSEWSDWSPATLKYGTAVTDPRRNSGPEHLFEMLPLVLATPAHAPAPEVGLTDSSIDCIVYEHTKLNPNQGADRALLTGIRHAVRDIIAALRAKENKL